MTNGRLHYWLIQAIAHPNETIELAHGLSVMYSFDDAHNEHRMLAWRMGVYPSVSEIHILQRTLRDMGKPDTHASMLSMRQNGRPLNLIQYRYEIAWPGDSEPGLTT